jgi:hypothetical protein
VLQGAGGASAEAPRVRVASGGVWVRVCGDVEVGAGR